MKQKLKALSQRYVSDLREHLKQGPQAGMNSAPRLGRQAVTLGLETLGLARIHGRALTTLKLSDGKAGLVKRAEKFFAKANAPIKESHRAARSDQARLGRLKAALSRSTQELAVADHQLQRGIVRRKVRENPSQPQGKDQGKCLKEALELQNVLRQLTHRVLGAQEAERKHISRELRDEIGQTLLGINVRLLALKQEARNNTKGLKNQIASAQRLVVRSAKSVRRFARKLTAAHALPGVRSLLAL